MNKAQKLALEVTSFITVFSLLFGIVFLFLFSDTVSMRDFFERFVYDQTFFGKDMSYFYFYVWIKACSLLIWVYLVTYFFAKKSFAPIEEYNKKLKDYNHYLAHEMKTPISVVYSNLDVLKYGFDADKVEKSQQELKNMKNIIDWLLNFSETLQSSEKKNINVENFIKNYIYFLKWSENIAIHNEEFNFSICTDETLFLRVIKNLIENAMKYSIDGKLNIFISKQKLTFENNIESTLDEAEIHQLLGKFYSQSFNRNGYGIGLSMIRDIVKWLWYQFRVISQDNKFIVDVIF